ncbi:MAG TPA: hypothetical protein VN625_01515 [Desulfuromonadaceae bacterium]|nr:hypothetical protein [Desulfuromonadaceae bacterium]
MKPGRNYFEFLIFSFQFSNSKLKIKKLKLFLLTLALSIAGAGVQAQSTPTGHAPSGFTAIDYYEAPNQMQMRSRMSGAEAQPMTGGLLVVKGLKLEMFTTNGETQVVVHAPECVYNTIKHTANSPGRLSLQNGDGKIRIEGTGFQWQQDNSILTISNNVHTTIETDSKEMFKP